MASEIDTTAVLFPVAVSGRIGAFAAADLLRDTILFLLPGWFGRRRIGTGFGGVNGFAYHALIPELGSLSPTPMTNNPQTPQTSWFALSDHRLVALSGRDAIAFAQAQTMNDVASLNDGQWHWNGWLTAKGRVIALFAVVRIHTDTLWLVLPDADANAFATQLRRFQFRSKVVIAVRDDLRIAGRLQASDLASGNHWTGDPESVIELDLSGTLGADHPGRSLRIGPKVEAPADASALAQWHRDDLEHGWPRLAASQVEQWTPQQLSLQRLHAYSVKKGCYPGQEIVARTHFLGQAKRGLVLVRTSVLLSAGAELLSGDTVAGTVISSSGEIALAVAPLDLCPPPRTDESPAGGGAFWTLQPLRNGLDR
jgi:tRNA-modifying protein YgfZ